MELFSPKVAINQHYKSFPKSQIQIDMKREDLLHELVSGNKLRKLKYNLRAASEQGHHTLLTYGGAYSNHIAATAAAGKLMGFKSIGIIRGEELGKNLNKTLNHNKTLQVAHDNGMNFKFVTRSDYRDKHTSTLKAQLEQEFGQFYNIPEGGTNNLAILGTQEILTDHDRDVYDVICVAAGTGGTAAGIIKSAAAHQQVIVFSALQGDFLRSEIQNLSGKKSFHYYSDDIFGGYGKSNDVLIDFMNTRFRESGIPLEPIYTAKIMYRLEQMVQEGAINGKTRILAIHTGGLQSIHGYNQILQKKKRPEIDYADQI
jgi:1-aminocyclopropane-1-carboxylate deaminase